MVQWAFILLGCISSSIMMYLAAYLPAERKFGHPAAQMRMMEARLSTYRTGNW